MTDADKANKQEWDRLDREVRILEDGVKRRDVMIGTLKGRVEDLEGIIDAIKEKVQEGKACQP